jgi:hypothetical protein
MSDLERVVDKFSGFITREQAEYILKLDDNPSSKPVFDFKKSNANVKELLSSIPAKKPQEKLSSSASEKETTVNVKDQIYRIFNPSSTNSNGRETTRRTVILGEEGSTIVLNLKDKLSEFIDINAFEEGDMVAVNNAVFDLNSGELKSVQNTVINKLSPSKKNAITDYKNIQTELRKVNLFGRVVEISPIRHVTRLGKTGQIAVASCIITDSENLMDASFWGSSALITANMKTNDFVKLEFCDIRNRDGKFQVYANDDSRVVINNGFAQKLKKK